MYVMSLDISGPVKNNDPSLTASGKETYRGHTVPFSAESNTYLHFYEPKTNMEKYYWPVVDSGLVVMPYCKALKMVNME